MPKSETITGDHALAPTNVSLELAAETHFYFKRLLEKALRGQMLTDDARNLFGQDWRTDFERWEGNFSRHFFDMTTMVRLAVATETALRDSYMRVKDISTLGELKQLASYKQGVFQRIQPWHNGAGTAAGIFAEISIDVQTLPSILVAQKVMLHRHLYAHSAGVIDEKYVDDWKKLTGEDLLKRPTLQQFLVEDLYWFEPLNSLTEYINDLRKFVTALP